MSDPYPPCFEIEIDREALKHYLRSNRFFSWLIILGLFGFFLGLLAAAEHLEAAPKVGMQVVLIGAREVAIGLAGSVILALALDWLLLKRCAALYANSLRLSVEGSFLRIQEASIVATTDWRLHFRAIVDYAIQQDWLMRRHSLETLLMTTTGGGQMSSVRIPGIKNGSKTRDMLSELDFLRENGP